MARIERSIWREQKDSATPKQQNAENAEIVEVDTGKIDTFVQQNSPVNNELIRNTTMNELYGTEVDGQLRIMPTSVLVRGQTKKTEPVYSLCSFSYDETVDLEILNKKNKWKISGYDRRVYNAVGTLWLNGRKTVSLTEIFDIMNGYAKANPSSKQIEAVEKSLRKLEKINVFIDCTDEVKKHVIEHEDILIEAGYMRKGDKLKKATIDSKMLRFDVGRLVFEDKKGKEHELKSIKIIQEPSLLTYNRAKGTLISIPMEYIGLTDSNATEKTIAFQDYLLMRIISYKNKKMFENYVVYDTLYRDSGIDRPEVPKDFKRDRETIAKLMDEWVKKGLITGYKEEKEGRAFVGIRFFVDGNEKIEEKE